MEKKKYGQLDNGLLEYNVSSSSKNSVLQTDSQTDQDDSKKVLVAGDIMLDIYCSGSVERISPEAPVPVLRRSGKDVKYALGGAANAAANLLAAGTRVDLFSTVGEDEAGKLLIEQLKHNGINPLYVLQLKERITTQKLRYIGQNNQQLFRVDSEVCEPVELETVRSKLDLLEQNSAEYDLFLLSDYGKGFLSEEITQYLIQLGLQLGIPVLVDVKDANFKKYRGATLLKPNKRELAFLTKKKTDTMDQVINASMWLCRETKSQYVLTTLGADGMVLTDPDRILKTVSSSAKEVYDVTGAGDTAMAYLAAEMAERKEIIEAMEVANYAAGVQVSKRATSIVYPDEVKRAMQGHRIFPTHKLLNMYQKKGLSVLKEEKELGKKIIFTNGCFDILHAGHIFYLQRAKEMGDLLVIGINSDASIQRLKGKDRPVNCLSDRIMLLTALEFVDYVVPFEEDTPLQLIQMIVPDMLVKGGDYSPDTIVGADIVRNNGGVVTTIPLVSGKSTSKIISKIRNEM